MTLTSLSSEFGDRFSYWKDADNNIISVYPSFNMRIAENATYTAVYGASGSPADGDGAWSAKVDEIKLSYKIERNNRVNTCTVYTDFSLRYIDGDRRIEELLGSTNADDLGYVESYGVVVGYDMNEENDISSAAVKTTLDATASLVAKMATTMFRERSAPVRSAS